MSPLLALSGRHNAIAPLVGCYCGNPHDPQIVAEGLFRECLRFAATSQTFFSCARFMRRPEKAYLCTEST
jgi:hypothetical protein